MTIPVGGTAQSLVRSKAGSQAPGTIIIAAETIGDGLFVLSGDSNAFSDFVLEFYTNNDNGVLARNLCLGPQQEQEYSFDGFSGPVEAGVVNTVKGGSTVPLKFRVFEGDIEVTDPAVVASFAVTPMTCPDADTPSDEVEFTTMGKTELRYTDGTFQQNWKTPKVKGCYQVTVATTDGATLSADFVLR